MPLTLGETADIVAADNVWSDSVALPALKTLILINRGSYPVEVRTTAEGGPELKLSPNGATGSVFVIPFEAATSAPTIIAARGVGGPSTLRVQALPVPAGSAALGGGGGGGGDISLSNAAPAALASAATAGTAETASRADHVHELPDVANVDLARAFNLGAPALADALNVHGAYDDDIAVDWPGPFTNPDVPRNLVVDFGGGADQNVTVSGTDQYDQPVSELFEVDAGVVTGSKVFKTVIGAAYAALGSGGNATIGTGNRLGIVLPNEDVVAVTNTGGLIRAGGSIGGVTVDTVNDAVYDSSSIVVPDGASGMGAIINVTHRHTLS